MTTVNERIPCHIFSRASEASVAAADEIEKLIRKRAHAGKTCVLGLVTGSSPTGIYEELVRRHRENGLSFKNVVTFNLDEFLPMQPNELQSVSRFMHEHLFDHIDLPAEQIYIPDGTISKKDASRYCQDYEQAIRNAGGIDLLLLGINRTGHIGLNEPGSDRTSRTRLITLDTVTRTDAASDFFGAENVPRYSITLGVATILEAKRILLLAFG
ncbi:MAG: 6-phosphogluconolactonase, partial [Rubripirellula sp.]